MSRAEMSVNQGTNDVYFPESNISIGKAIVNSEPASEERDVHHCFFFGGIPACYE